MTAVASHAVFIVRREDGRSCGHDHGSDVTGQLCLAAALDQARARGHRGATFTLNRVTAQGDESVERVMYA